MSYDDQMPELPDDSGPTLPEHFYFHVPFCKAKCSYCDFNSVVCADPDQAYAVFTGMEAEARRWAFASMPGVIETVYVGGGTPSLFASHVADLIGHVRHELPVRSDAEITVEANPDSLPRWALEELLAAGANRISIGVQAFDDHVLKLLGRLHDSSQARAALALVAETRADLAIDLMCGIPGQSIASWAETLEQALDAKPVHVSVYPLALEEGTPLEAAVSGGIVAEPDPDLAAEMMLMAAERLGMSGFSRYEIANYSLLGKESRHNTAYWTGKSYAACGPGAHAMYDAATASSIGLFLESAHPEVARVRYADPSGIESWLTGGPGELELLDAATAEREDVMLGLRLTRGIEVERVAAAGLAGVLESLESQGLVERAEGRWRTTTRGWLLGNEVFGRVWAGE